MLLLRPLWYPFVSPCSRQKGHRRSRYLRLDRLDIDHDAWLYFGRVWTNKMTVGTRTLGVGQSFSVLPCLRVVTCANVGEGRCGMKWAVSPCGSCDLALSAVWIALSRELCSRRSPRWRMTCVRESDEGLAANDAHPRPPHLAPLLGHPHARSVCEDRSPPCVRRRRPPEEVRQ